MAFMMTVFWWTLLTHECRRLCCSMACFTDSGCRCLATLFMAREGYCWGTSSLLSVLYKTATMILN